MEYLSNHLFDYTPILNLSLDEQILFYKSSGEVWKIGPIRSAIKALALSQKFSKAVPSQPQPAHKHPLTKGKLTLLPSSHHEPEQIL